MELRDDADKSPGEILGNWASMFVALVIVSPVILVLIVSSKLRGKR